MNVHNPRERASRTGIAGVPIAAVAAVAAPAAGALEVTFVAASTAALDNPHDLKLAPDGRHLFVSDFGGEVVAELQGLSSPCGSPTRATTGS